MLTPKQIKIFEVFMRKPYKEFTYKEIKDFSKEKSNSIIQKAISKFIDEGLIKKNQIGNIFLYNLDFTNDNIFSYFNILIKESLPNPSKKLLNKLKKN